MEGLVIILILIFFVLGYVIGHAAGKPPPCRHSTRTTTFYGMDDLRKMFSGEITAEEWKKRPDMKIVSKCADCGKVL